MALQVADQNVDSHLIFRDRHTIQDANPVAYNNTDTLIFLASLIFLLYALYSDFLSLLTYNFNYKYKDKVIYKGWMN